jgi:hypothetical protein
MPPSVIHVLRAVLVALVGAIATVVINSFDKFNDDSPFDDHDDF